MNVNDDTAGGALDRAGTYAFGLKKAGITATAAFALAALILPVRAWAAPPDDDGPPGPAVAGDQGREDLVETVEIYMLAKMKRELNLTHEQELKVVPVVQGMGEARRSFMRERRLTMMKLRPMLADPNTPDKDFSPLLDKLRTSEKDFRDTEEKSRGEIASVLTPRQQAQFLLFQEKFQADMQQRLRRLRGMGPGGPRGPGPDGEPGPGERRRRGDQVP